MNRMESPNIVSPRPVSLGEWMVAFLVTSIPLIGLVVLLVWSFDTNTNPSKSSWARAMLVWYLISFVIFFVLLILALGLNFHG